jgi:hypothetical protein
VGTIIGLRPTVQAVVGITNANFDRLWTMAMSGQLRCSWLALTEPHRRYACIVSASFGNEFEE